MEIKNSRAPYTRSIELLFIKEIFLPPPNKTSILINFFKDLPLNYFAIVVFWSTVTLQSVVFLAGNNNLIYIFWIFSTFLNIFCIYLYIYTHSYFFTLLYWNSLDFFGFFYILKVGVFIYLFVMLSIVSWSRHFKIFFNFWSVLSALIPLRSISSDLWVFWQIKNASHSFGSLH